MSDIQRLFDTDPLSLSDADIAAIVAKQRKHQAQYELGIKAPSAAKPPKPKSTKTLDLLKDLGLA